MTAAHHRVGGPRRYGSRVSAPSVSRRPAAALAAVALVVAALGVALAPPAPARAADIAVDVVDDAYAPGTVEVAVGETVTWTWRGRNPHSVTSPGSFDSHAECTSLTPESCGQTGERYTFTATEPGSIGYRCRIHPGMTGTIVVVAAPAPTTPPPASPSPTASPTGTPPPPSPSPTPRPSSPTPAPTPAPTPTPRPSTPSPSGSPSPTPASGIVGPPSSPSPQAVPTITPTATASAPATASPRRDGLTPFPSAPPPGSEDPLTEDTVAVDVPGSDGPGDGPVRAVAVGLFGATVLAFGRLVLFAPPWA